MRKWKYIIAILLLAVDILLFAELGKEMSVPKSSMLLSLLNLTENRVVTGWIMVALAVIFLIGLVLLVRWAVRDVKQWVEREISEPTQ